MVRKSELVREASETDDQWEPAGLIEDLEGLDKENFTYRWCLKDSVRQKKLRAEHWEPVNSLEGDAITHRQSIIGKQEGNTAADGSTNYRELILMKLPKKWANARARYHREKNEKVMQAVNREVKSASDGNIRPTLVLNQGGEKVTVIE